MTARRTKRDGSSGWRDQRWVARFDLTALEWPAFIATLRAMAAYVGR